MLALFDNYSGEDIEASLISGGPQWKVPEVLGPLFGYPFNQLKTNRVTLRVKADNRAAVKLSEKLGFKLEGTVREALDGKDVLIYGMLKRECKHIGLNDGQEEHTRTAAVS